jgi:3-mercaptopyruvate sulfurtransferase SseA/predicted small secreted protein
MRFLISLSAAMLFAALVLTACNSLEQHHGVGVSSNNTGATPTTTNTQQAEATLPGDGVRRITTVDLKNMLDKGQAVVVDVRADASWEAGHIRGARHIPTDKILSEAEGLPRDKTIVTYCS